jgi:hypothetical protein
VTLVLMVLVVVVALDVLMTPKKCCCLDAFHLEPCCSGWRHTQDYWNVVKCSSCGSQDDLVAKHQLECGCGAKFVSGASAPKATHKALRSAKFVMDHVDQVRAPPPQVTPVPNGEIQMVWGGPDKELKVVCSFAGDLRFQRIGPLGERVWDGCREDVSTLVSWLLDR